MKKLFVVKVFKDKELYMQFLCESLGETFEIRKEFDLDYIVKVSSFESEEI